jgi:arylformamidase
MSIDYEAEYNNRARVPEHPAIFERWGRDAEAYRQASAISHRVELGISYGPTDRQIFDLFLPAEGAAAPLVMFIHGGYWRALDPSSFSHMARGLNARGLTVAVVGYNLCPQVMIEDIIAEIRRATLHLWQRFGRRIVVTGHSAGGHLAACMVATDWKSHGAPANLVPAGYSISGLFDLAPLIHTAMNVDFQLDEFGARRVSPLVWPVAPGRIFDAIVGGDESSEFLRQSKLIAETWGKLGVATRYEAVPGMNHFTVIDALAEPKSAMVARITELALLTR